MKIGDSSAPGSLLGSQVIENCSIGIPAEQTGRFDLC